MNVDWIALLTGLIGGSIPLLITTIVQALKARHDALRDDRMAEAEIRSKDVDTESKLTNAYRQLLDDYKTTTNEIVDKLKADYDEKLRESHSDYAEKLRKNREECESYFAQEIEQRDRGLLKSNAMIDYLDSEVIELRAFMASKGLEPPPRKPKPTTGELGKAKR